MTLKDKLIVGTTSLVLIVGGAANLTGCTSISRDLNKTEQLDRKIDLKQEEQEVYEFADKLSRKIPEDFVKSRSGSQGWIYHDKSLEVSKGDDVDSLLEGALEGIAEGFEKVEGLSAISIELNGDLFSGWPKSGEGRAISYTEGNLSVGYCDCNEMKLVEEEKIKPADMKKTKGFCYIKDNDEEKMGISNNPILIVYTKKDDKWIKQYFDVTKIEKDTEKVEDIPIISEAPADKKEVKKYLKLVERLRKTYSVSD